MRIAGWQVPLTELARKVEDSVIRSRSQERWRVEYMTLQEHDGRVCKALLTKRERRLEHRGIGRHFR